MSGLLDRTPRSLLVWDRSSFLDERNRLSSQVEQLHFNYKVAVSSVTSLRVTETFYLLCFITKCKIQTGAFTSCCF